MAEMKREMAPLPKSHTKMKVLALLVLVLILNSCDKKNGRSEYQSAQKILLENPKKGLTDMERVLRVYPNSQYAILGAKEIVEHCPKSKECGEEEIFFLKFLLQKDLDQKEILFYLKRLAEVYFEKGYYSQAIETTNVLISKSPQGSADEILDSRLILIKSYFYLKKFYQAEVELNDYIKKVPSGEKKASGLALQAEILGAQKKQKEASEVYEKIKQDYPDGYFKNQIFMSEALFYEEQKLLDQAIEVLESALEKTENPEFVGAKIEKLKERKSQLPGASGLRR